VLATVLLPILALVLALIFFFDKQIGHFEILVFVAMYLVTAIGASVGLHRLFTHNSFKAVPVVRYSLAIAGSMADQGPLVEWVAIHRLHHRFADREGDPHSPYFPRTSIFRVNVRGSTRLTNVILRS
jgi:stearoyl-CoA desaturase (Delta-9 desaturase)